MIPNVHPGLEIEFRHMQQEGLLELVLGVGLKEVFLSALFESKRPREVFQAKKTRLSRAQNFEA